MDLGKNGSKGVATNEILCHNRGREKGNEILEGGTEGPCGANKRQVTNRSGAITNEEYFINKYKITNRVHEANKGDCNNKNN